MGNVIDLNEKDFDTVVLQSEVPVLVDFWSPACVPCRTVAPILEELAVEYGDDARFVKINIFENTVVAGKLGVSTLPTLVIYNKGQVVERLVGVQDRDKLMDLLDEYC